MTTSQDHMDCQEVEDLLPLVVDGVIDEESDPSLFAHIASCPRCQESLATYDLIDLALGDGRAITRPQPSAEVIHYRIPGLWAAAAALACALATGVWLNQSQENVTDTSTPLVAESTVKILEVLPNHGDQNQPAFVIQDGDTVRVISGNQLDGGIMEREATGAQAVSNERFPHSIRQVGAID